MTVVRSGGEDHLQIKTHSKLSRNENMGPSENEGGYYWVFDILGGNSSSFLSFLSQADTSVVKSLHRRTPVTGV